MADPTRHILLLSGRLGARQHGGPIRAFVERLATQGIGAQVLCLDDEEGADADERIVECPGLVHRWRQALAIRRLGIGGAIRTPDLVHVLDSSVGSAGLALAEHWRLPYVQTIEEYLGPRERLRLSRRWCRGLVVVGEELAKDLVTSFGVPRSFLSVIAPAITSAGVLSPCQKRPNHIPVIGTAGPLVASSGYATFLVAARRVVDAGIDAEFVISGQGEDEVDLRRRAARLKIADRVTFADQPGFGQRFWSVLDVYCQTNLVPTVGRTLAMAMASGVPSITSDIEGVRAFVRHDETALRVPPNDSTALARTILALLGDPERAARLSQHGRETVLHVFDPDEEARNLASLYRSVIDGVGQRVAQPALSV